MAKNSNQKTNSKTPVNNTAVIDDSYIRSNYPKNKSKWNALVDGSDKMSEEDVIQHLIAYHRYGRISNEQF